LKQGKRVPRVRYGVDEEICTGDHSCIRLSGCPSLTIKSSPDPLRTDPVATVIESCVGCGLCGEVAHAAVLCPSFYRAEIVRNPTRWDREVHKLRQRVIGWLSPSPSPSFSPPPCGEGSGVGVEVGALGASSSYPPPQPSPTRGEGARVGASPQGGREPSVPGERSPRPIKLLIAALGGEGGGVLTDWIVSAAADAGYPVQSTSIPGVAQRTGATTYYIEILPTLTRDLNGKRPVLALAPGVGDIDLAVASELLEAGRTVAGGFVTPERTQVIASTSRAYAMDEKIAMGDGRLDSKRLIEAVSANAQNTIFIDMAELAKASGSVVSAVMLGAIAASGRLPLSQDQLEAAIRADGKAVDANLRGFGAGLKAARANAAPAAALPAKSRAAAALDALEQEVARTIPEAARDFALEGVRRLTAYENADYARLYLARLKPVAEADARAGMQGKLLREAARHLAVRMSFEDIVRVAEAKIAPARLARIARDELHVTDEPFSVHDFLKPGIEELTQLLPPVIARPILRIAEKKGWLGRVYFGMLIQTTSVSGYLRFLALAKLRGLRRYGIRYKDEQAQIESWLRLVLAAAERSGEFALEVAECARLIKGYGDTHERGWNNYAAIERRIVRPALQGSLDLSRAVDAIASARTAALADPEGESLNRCINEMETRAPLLVAAE
jgi:indolepyruvate ferredoxin oxidoreductase beta subunit